MTDTSAFPTTLTIDTTAGALRGVLLAMRPLSLSWAGTPDEASVVHLAVRPGVLLIGGNYSAACRRDGGPVEGRAMLPCETTILGCAEGVWRVGLDSLIAAACFSGSSLSPRDDETPVRLRLSVYGTRATATCDVSDAPEGVRSLAVVSHGPDLLGLHALTETSWCQATLPAHAVELRILQRAAAPHADVVDLFDGDDAGLPALGRVWYSIRRVQADSAQAVG